ncbi:hypothetical protein [Methylobacter sp. sgz302048]|uniref:hypothetical protein n=1 Tax=Methylobacter sp. sgz302048 TaxID=3455945 RepID=UPI003F9F4526
MKSRVEDFNPNNHDCWEQHHITDKRITVLENKMETMEQASVNLIERQEKHEQKVDVAFEKLCVSLDSAVSKFETFETTVKTAWKTITIGGMVLGAILAALWAVASKVLPLIAS